MKQIRTEEVKYSEVTSATQAFLLSLKSASKVAWGYTLGIFSAQMNEINYPKYIVRATDQTEVLNEARADMGIDSFHSENLASAGSNLASTFGFAWHGLKLLAGNEQEKK